MKKYSDFFMGVYIIAFFILIVYFIIDARVTKNFCKEKYYSQIALDYNGKIEGVYCEMHYKAIINFEKRIISEKSKIDSINNFLNGKHE